MSGNTATSCGSCNAGDSYRWCTITQCDTGAEARAVCGGSGGGTCQDNGGQCEGDTCNGRDKNGNCTSWNLTGCMFHGWDKTTCLAHSGTGTGQNGNYGGNCWWQPSGVCTSACKLPTGSTCGTETCTDTCGTTLPCGSVSCCTANTTSVTLSPGGLVGVGQITQMVTPTNSSGQPSNLSVSPNPAGWSVTNAASGMQYAMNIGTYPLGTGGVNQTYTVTASVPAGSYCASSGTASFTCTPAAPTATQGQPALDVTGAPSAYNWTIGDWGMDRCGGNDPGGTAGGYPDTLSVSLFSNSSPNCTGALLTGSPQCTLGTVAAHSQTSCANTYTGWTAGTTYWWQLTVDNGLPGGAGRRVLCQQFTVKPTPGAWYQAVDGHVLAGGTLATTIPPLCSVPGGCYLEIPNFSYAPGTPAFPGVPIYGGSLSVAPPTAVSPAVSGTSWSANVSANANFSLPLIPSTSDFLKQVPVPAIPMSSWGDLTAYMATHPVPSDAYYFSFSPTSGTLTVPAYSAGANKVVVFVPNPGVTTELTGDITTTRGQGFFGLVSAGPVVVGPSAANRHLEGLYFTDGSFGDLSLGGGTPDGKLTVSGMVIAKGSVSLGRDLDPGKTTGANNASPAEQFTFGPDFLFTLPSALDRVQYQLNEVPPTG